MSLPTRDRVIQIITDMPQHQIFTSGDLGKMVNMTPSEVGGIIKSVSGDDDDCLVEPFEYHGANRCMRVKSWRRK